ncbi:PREDICTED: uncharacterized protein LOC109591550 [Amphimedon queenslandica]|uniref:Uncharacterized protein n=2 Tax=Amphimedon queenslandica TaxID=400682 RepID=A0AAN0K0D9_AMPQE|nr:PREDICTED: uncharacterized protein LOC109591550 [Amphimedon queenslandica]|eukprot:XP_019862825.1 PREDICTED: uncharacterized protein LOC109591550 [Amphimedon queenslandica]
MTVTCSSLHNNNSNSLFLIFRHHLCNIISSTGNSVSLKYCCEFLHFIVTYISRLSLMTHTATLDGIITNLTNTIQLLESCDQLNGGGIHVLLHVYWTMVSLLYTAVIILGDKYVSMFNEECNRIIKYLLKQREDAFDTASVFKNGVPSLFPCSCFLEVWLLLAKATDWTSSTNRTPVSMYMYMYYIPSVAFTRHG